MLGLIGYGTAVLVVVLVTASPLWARLAGDAVVPIVIAALHGLGMMGLSQWALAGGRRVRVTPHPADYVTMTRAMIGSGCLAVVAAALAGSLALPTWWLAVPAAVALALDAVDGPVARRTGTASPAGGRYDMESDAVFVVIIALAAAWVHGPWVLLIGVLRYLFVIAAMIMPRLRRSLGFSQRRRLVAALQGIALVVSIVPVVPAPAAVTLLVIAFALLLISFGLDTVALLRHDPDPRPG